MIRKFFVYPLIALALGCSRNDDKQQDNAKENVFSSQIQAIDKARQVDKQVEDAAGRQRKEIDDRGG